MLRSEAMGNILISLIHILNSGFRTRASLLIEILVLRHQLAILKQSAKKRPRLRKSDRFLWVWISRWWPGWRNSLLIVKPETVLAWHRKGFRLYWAWKSRRRPPGRPDTTQEIRDLIRKMSTSNATWGAPRIHGELLKLGIEVSQATVAKYMIRRSKPPSQTWRTFLENHVKTMVSVDFFAVPTISFRVLFVFLVLAHDRRRVLHFNVTAHSTAEWTADQILQAFPWDTAHRYLLRDRDCIYGDTFRRQVSSMGIKSVGFIIATSDEQPDRAHCVISRAIPHPNIGVLGRSPAF